MAPDVRPDDQDRRRQGLTTDTIYALSSGNPPAAIAMVRISGPRAMQAVAALVAHLPPPRQPSLRVLRDPHSGEILDRALCLCFAGPATVTGEDIAELHLHGGRAVVEGVLGALSGLPGLRAAEPGEFTRRAFISGRMDLTEVEGLADLLAAETQAQRRQAMRLADGGLSRLVEVWRERILMLAATVEAAIDYDDEAEALLDEDRLRDDLRRAAAELADLLAHPPAERLRDGIRVVLAGPPNAGKSSLLNVLVGREAAIVSEVAGTTRDRIEVPVTFGGIAFLFIDTAGLRDTDDAIERIGVKRAAAAIREADICLWLGKPANAPSGAVIRIAPKSDLGHGESDADITVSAMSGHGIRELQAALVDRARTLLPAPDAIAFNERQRTLLSAVGTATLRAADQPDMLLVAEDLRMALSFLDQLTGRAGVEDLLSSLFGRFCLGK